MVKIGKAHGNLDNLKKYHIERLEALYEITCEREQILSPELAGQLSSISGQINREVAVYINRRGQIVDVLVGDVSTVSLEAIEGRRGQNRLSGIRCIHTHPNGSGVLSSIDITAMKLLRLDAMVAIEVKGELAGEIYAGYINSDPYNENEDYLMEGPFNIETVNDNNFMLTIGQIEDKLQQKKNSNEFGNIEEKAILVGLQKDTRESWDISDSLRELTQLAETAGVTVVGSVIQNRPRPDVAYFIGQGKAREVNLLRQSYDANVIIFDDELSPAQLRNLEQLIGAKVIDRTALILDIFAQRARTREGKLQVELAQLNYLLPRLTGQGIALSRLGGGIGTRGPGETKLEMDRRRIRKRISDLEKELAQVRKNRELQRESRKNFQLPVVAMVGYTNAGKSTLLNKLTNSDVLAEDKLFATLDPTTRKVLLPDNQAVLLTDTVGFIKKIPHHLVAAFRATLEEVVEADVLLHVVDASHPKYAEQMAAVYEVLKQLKVIDKPVITVFNKIDKIKREEIIPTEAPHQLNAYISAASGEGIDELLKIIAGLNTVRSRRLQLNVPYSEAATVAMIHREAKVISENYGFENVELVADVPDNLLTRLEKYIVRSEKENAR